MSANVPPAFKPIAHYIKIANENASRDPVIYYWWMCMMALDTSSGPPFNVATWQRLQEAIQRRESSTQQRDELREMVDEPDGIVRDLEHAQQISVNIEEKKLKIAELRKRISLVNQKILVGIRKKAEIDEKIQERREKEENVKRKSTATEELREWNHEKKEKLKRETEILLKLLRHRKIHMLKETMSIFKVEIDGGPASRNGQPLAKTCNCQLIDSIRNLHLPHSSAPFDHPEIPTIAALHHFLHLFDVICKILDYSERYPTTLTSPRVVRNPMKSLEVSMDTWRRRLDRERFEEALGWIAMNIGQLRMDCGNPTMARSRPIAALEEWLRLVDSRETVFERPKNSGFSAANLLIEY